MTFPTKATIIGLCFLACASAITAFIYLKRPVISSYTIKTLQPVTLNQAKSITEKCGASGTFEFHNGQIGLVMKGSGFQPVKGATLTELMNLSNPSCPFTMGISE